MNTLFSHIDNMDNRFDDFAKDFLNIWKDGEFSYESFKSDNPDEKIPQKLANEKSYIKSSWKLIFSIMNNFDEKEFNKIRDNRHITKQKTMDILVTIFNKYFANDQFTVNKCLQERKTLKQEILRLKKQVKELEIGTKVEDNMLKREEDKELRKQVMETEKGQELLRVRELLRKKDRNHQSAINKLQQRIAFNEQSANEYRDKLIDVEQENMILKKSSKKSNNIKSKNTDKYKRKYKDLKVEYEKAMKIIEANNLSLDSDDDTSSSSDDD